MNRMDANHYTYAYRSLLGALLAGVLCVSNLWPGSAGATEFNIMQPSAAPGPP